MATTFQHDSGSTTTVFPLANGDRLTRTEFERRYAAMTEVKKAELIQGVVYVGTPVRVSQHARQHALLISWAMNYAAATPGLEVADNATVRLTPDSEPQPDLLIRVLPEHGGATATQDGYIVGPPELVAEVAASSANYDLHDKLAAYRDAGVREYLVWRVLDRAFDWFVWENAQYSPQTPDQQGELESPHFPGLRLHVPSLLEENANAVFETLRLAVETAEHRAFVSKLLKTKKA